MLAPDEYEFEKTSFLSTNPIDLSTSHNSFTVIIL